MKSVIQCVRDASVRVGERTIGTMEKGVLVYLGIQKGDTERQLEWLCGKIAKLRIFPDEAGKRNRSVGDVGGGILVVSQFTLCANVRKGNRPSYDDAARPDDARILYERSLSLFAGMGFPVAHGEFGSHMEVEYLNDGPMTILLDA